VLPRQKGLLPRQKGLGLGLTLTEPSRTLKRDPETPPPPDTGCSLNITTVQRC